MLNLRPGRLPKGGFPDQEKNRRPLRPETAQTSAPVPRCSPDLGSVIVLVGKDPTRQKTDLMPEALRPEPSYTTSYRNRTVIQAREHLRETRMMRRLPQFGLDLGYSDSIM